MAKVLLQFTKNYDMFLLMEDNRDVSDEKHIKDLMGSMERNGFLQSKAISVRNNSNKYEVLDGQHRLEAAKRLGIAVWYNIDDEIPVTALPDLQISKKWLPKDFLKHFVMNGVKSYIKLQELSLQYPKVSITTIALLLEGCNQGEGSVNRFKSGTIKITAWDKAVTALKYADELYTLYKQEWLFGRTFLVEFIHIIGIPGYKQKTLLEKLKYRSEEFRQMLSAAGYLKMIEQVYNYKAHASNRIKFEH